jgi:hypothetical protein
MWPYQTQSSAPDAVVETGFDLFFHCFLNQVSYQDVVGQLRQRDGATKLLGSKFTKQAGSNSVDSHPKAEP